MRELNRRGVIGLVGGAAAWPVVVRAQQRSTVPVIGFLYAGSPETFAARLAAFRQGLKESGYVEGQNVAIEFRWAEGHFERLPVLATELVQRQVNVIAAVGTEAPVLAVKNATSAIPIVFQIGGDPVAAGLVDSLNHPGGHITGVTRMVVEVVAKSLEVLHRIVPNAAEIAFLLNPVSPEAEQSLQNIQDAARSLGLQKIQPLYASSEREIDAAIGNAVRFRVGALLINTDSVFNSHIEQLAALTLRHALPALYSTREFAAAGGLVSYGASLPDQYRQVGAYVGRILAGAKPANLPVLQPTKFDLVINLRTAKALGLEIPPTPLATADEVIE